MDPTVKRNMLAPGLNFGALYAQKLTNKSSQKILNFKHGDQSIGRTSILDIINLFNNNKNEKILIKRDGNFTTADDPPDEKDYSYHNKPREFQQTLDGLINHHNFVTKTLDNDELNYNYLIHLQAGGGREHVKKRASKKNSPKMLRLNRFDISKTRGPFARTIFEDCYRMAKKLPGETDKLRESLPRLIMGYQPLLGTGSFDLMIYDHDPRPIEKIKILTYDFCPQSPPREEDDEENDYKNG